MKFDKIIDEYGELILSECIKILLRWLNIFNNYIVYNYIFYV